MDALMNLNLMLSFQFTRILANVSAHSLQANSAYVNKMGMWLDCYS